MENNIEDKDIEYKDFSNKEYQIFNTNENTEFIYVVLTEDCYGGDGDGDSNNEFLVKVFRNFDKASSYANKLGYKFNKDVIIMKKKLE